MRLFFCGSLPSACISDCSARSLRSALNVLKSVSSAENAPLVSAAPSALPVLPLSKPCPCPELYAVSAAINLVLLSVKSRSTRMFVASDTSAIKSAGCIFVPTNFFAASTERSICSGSIAEKSKKSSINRRLRASSDGAACFPERSSVPPATPDTVVSAVPAVCSSSTFSKSKVEISCFFPSSKSVKSPFFRSRTRFPFLSCATTFTSTSSLVTSMRDSFPPACPLRCAVDGGAAGMSSPAAVKIENVFVGSLIIISLQNRKRACIVTRRIPPVPVTSPYVEEFTTVLMVVKCTLLKTLLAVIRRSSARDSLIVIVLLSDMFIETCPGPSMIFLPASPKVVGLPAGQLTFGVQNAAVLNHRDVDGSLTETDWPATMFARCDPLTPRPMSSPAPSTRGVKYNPDPTVKSPLHCHPPRTWLHAPLVTNRRLSPNGKSMIQFPVNLCR